MKMRHSVKSVTHSILAAALLLVLGAQIAPSARAESAVHVRSSIVDTSKGIELYSVSYNANGKDHNEVVYRQQDGTYAKWQEPFQFFSAGEDGTVINIWTNDPEGGYVYDPDRGAMIHKRVYSLSPDGKWGLLERPRYLYVASPEPSRDYVAKLNDFYLKNMRTGEVTLYHSTRTRFFTAWHDQHTLLESGYDSRAKQNMITAFDPQTGKRTTVLAGTMYAYNNSTSKLLYVENEPLRLERVYDWRTASSHLLKDDAERLGIYPSWLSRPEPVTPLPAGVNPVDLPVVPVPVVEEYEYTAEINGRGIPVPTVFKVNGTQWIPVRPLAEALGWKVELADQPGQSYKAANYRYTISNGEAKVVLTPSKSFNTGFRLYITQGQLASLGYEKVKLVPHVE